MSDKLQMNPVGLEGLLRDTLDRVDDGFFILDRDWCFVYLNDRAFDSMHESFNTQEVLGRNIWEVSPQLLGTPYESIYRQAMTEGTPAHFEIQAYSNQLWYEVHVYPLPEGLAISFRNINDRKLAEVALRESEKGNKQRRERQEFLAEASKLLSGTLEFRETLSRLARLAVPRIADWCVIHVKNHPGLEVVEVAHTDPAKMQLAREVNERFPPRSDSASAQVYESGESQLVREITPEMLDAANVEDDYRAVLKSLGLRSVMIVPLTARDSRIGVMTFIYAESGRLYNEDDVAFAEDLASRAAIAADNARLFEDAQRARAEAERREREEAALRKATEAVSATFSVNEVIQEIAHRALDATHADGSFVERISPDGESIVVVATAGEICPELGASVPFAGSVAEYILEKKQPQIVESLGQLTSPLPGTLAATHATAKAIAVPLIDAGEAIGALILLRGESSPPFTMDEAERAHTFGNLASLAFRKVHLLEASEQRSRELEQVMESRTRLMRGFSHDLKNPLGAADGHAALLQDGMLGELTPQQMNSVSRIRNGIATAVSLINDLVELARAEAGQIIIKKQPVDVREIAREIVEQYRPGAEQAGLSIRAELGAVEIISTDADRTRQVLGNLVSNAVKYTRSGGSVVVATGMRDEKVAIDVVDTGIGIPDDKLDVLFKEFERIDPSVVPGVGLGLAISRRLARLLGGDVTAQSKRGVGSTFTLWLTDAA